MDLTKSPPKMVRTSGADLMAKVLYNPLHHYHGFSFKPERNLEFFLRMYRDSMHYKVDFTKQF